MPMVAADELTMVTTMVKDQFGNPQGDFTGFHEAPTASWSNRSDTLTPTNRASPKRPNRKPTNDALG